ncbi:hypothetical protein PG987_010000 [Apiospora arundinis]
MGQEGRDGDGGVPQGGNDEEAARLLRVQADQISRESQWWQEEEAESEEVRQWLERQRRNREEEARRREEWVDHTQRRRQRARGPKPQGDLQRVGQRLPRPGSLPDDGPRGDEAAADLFSPDMVARQKEVLARLVKTVNETFQEKRAGSDRRDWCNPIPFQRN